MNVSESLCIGNQQFDFTFWASVASEFWAGEGEPFLEGHVLQCLQKSKVLVTY
jgi:hypothetical protein